MASLTSSSSSRSSSSSYRSSSRYSSCSSFRSEESAGGQTLAPLGSPLGPLLEPFLDPAAPHSMFGEEDTVGTLCRAPFSRHRRESHGYQGEYGLRLPVCVCVGVCVCVCVFIQQGHGCKPSAVCTYLQHGKIEIRESLIKSQCFVLLFFTSNVTEGFTYTHRTAPQLT